MSSEELRLYERPALERPILIAAFRGWNDGGQAATLATGYLARLWGAHKFGDIDPELFVDFQATRPSVSLEDGKTRRIDWPENAFFRAHIPDTSRDVVLLIGVEPNYRWRTFTDVIADLAEDLGIEMVITLGALLADVPHTRAAPVTGAATDQRLVDELGLQLSRYEGPTGIVGVLLDACRRQSIPSVSLWAAVPHYVSLAPSPPAARALCERLAGVIGTDIDISELAEAESAYIEQVSQAVASDADTSAYVEELEQRADSLDSWLENAGGLPSGEALAAEITRFLRERERNGGGGQESGGAG
jgi:proteasome assembly chaperone (PAC2) family protein